MLEWGYSGIAGEPSPCIKTCKITSIYNQICGNNKSNIITHNVGYAGLVSHGGTLGLILVLFLFCKKTKIKFLKILDIIAIAVPLAAGFIKIANFQWTQIILLDD